MTKREFTSSYESGYEYNVVGNVVTETYYQEDYQYQPDAPPPKKHGRALFQIILLFVLGIAPVWGYSSLNEANDSLQVLKQEYETLRKDNDHVKEQLEQSINLNKIREIAINRLGMRRPDKSQIIYIKLKTDDYGEAVEDE